MRETKELRDVLNFDKKFNGLQYRAIDRVLSFSHVSAETMKEMKVEGGDVRLLSVGQFEGFTTKEIASHSLCYGEVITIPTGGTANFKYHNGYFVDSGNILCSPKNETINGKYVYYFLCKNVNLVDSMFQGASIKHPKMSEICKIPIPICSFDEQNRIVSVLDLLTGIIDKQKQQLKELDNLAQSIFYDMFGNPVDDEKGWKKVKMSDACKEIGDGLHGTPNYDENGTIAFINGNNLIDGHIVITDRTQFVNESEAKKIFIKLTTNTILLSINGTLGKVAIYNNEKVVLGKSACYCILKDFLHPTFVYSLMKTSEFQQFLEESSSKSTIKNVGLKAIRAFDIIVPSLEAQMSFVKQLQEIESQKESINRSIAESQKLFDYTMDKYFG